MASSFDILNLSDRFDLEDIRKIRNYNAQRYANMEPAEIVAITREGAKKVLKYLDAKRSEVI